MDGGGAFDHALARDGWIAIRVGYELAAYRDGSLLNPMMLASVWQVRPALSPSMVLISVYQGRSRLPNEGATLAVLDRDGVVQRSALLPLRGPVGEIAAGIVAADGLWSWAGDSLPQLGRGTPIGVLEGRAVVYARDDEIEVIGADGAVLGSCATPAGCQLSGDVGYDAGASRLAATARHMPGVLVVDLVHGPRWMPTDLVPYHPVWLGDHGLLLMPFCEPSGAVILDLASGTTTALGLSRLSPHPRLDVTGRFDPLEVQAVLRPARWVPLTAGQREAALAASRRALDDAAPEALRRHIDRARSSIRLRACLPPRRLPLGGSRLGGRPDLPPGWRWPTRNGAPITFLAQLRLEEISSCAPDGALPSEGLLLLFVDLEPDGGYVRDDHVQAEIVDGSALRRATWPKRLAEELRFRPASLIPEPFLSLPSDSPAPDVDDAAWFGLLDAVTSRLPHHRMLGYPLSTQEVDPPCDENGEFALLLQLASDGATGMSFGDGGSLQFWVAPKSLAVGDLSHCVVEHDSY